MRHSINFDSGMGSVIEYDCSKRLKTDMWNRPKEGFIGFTKDVEVSDKFAGNFYLGNCVLFALEIEPNLFLGHAS